MRDIDEIPPSLIQSCTARFFGWWIALFLGIGAAGVGWWRFIVWAVRRGIDDEMIIGLLLLGLIGFSASLAARLTKPEDKDAASRGTEP